MDDVAQKAWDAYTNNPSDDNRNALVMVYLPWLKNVSAKAFAKLPTSSGWVLDDVLSWAVLGAMSSMQRFDPGLGMKFESYALRRVLGSITDHLREMDWVPRQERLLRKGDPTIPKMISMDSRSAQRHDEKCRIDTIDNLATCPFEDDPKRDHWWRQVCRGLSRQERLLVLMYYRLQMTLKECGHHLGVSESRCSQTMAEIHGRMLAKGKDLLGPRIGNLAEVVLDAPQAPIKGARPPKHKRARRRTRSQMAQLEKKLRSVLASGPCTFGELVKKTGAAKQTLSRVLSRRAFCRADRGRYALSNVPDEV